MMIKIAATLIQGISEFREYIRLFFVPCLEAYPSADEEDVLKWIICEELEEIYHLFDKNHIHNRVPHIHIRDMLRGNLPLPLSQVVGWYIKAPKVYSNDDQVDVVLRDRDLYIHYYTDIQHIQQ